MELDIPPGLYRNGTQFQSRGRWYDGSLVRWHGGATQPVGGWSQISMTGNEISEVGEGSTGFGDYVLDEAPPDWTEHYIRGSGAAGAPGTWVVAGHASSPSGQVISGGGPLYGGVLTWDAVSPFADGEVLALVRIRGQGTTLRQLVNGIAVRHNSTGDSMDGVYCILNTNNGFNFAIYSGPSTPTGPWSGSPITSTNLSPRPLHNEFWWIRFNFEGSHYRAKAWIDGSPEPASWQLDVTNPNPTTDAGSIGIGSTNSTHNNLTIAALVAYSTSPDVSAEDLSGGGGGTVLKPPSAIDEPILGALAWRDNDNVPWLAMGTPTNCWIYSEGLARTIMPVDFREGSSDGSTEIAGYGTGAYGAGLYGEGVVNSVGTVLEAQSWQFDTFGELLVAHAHSDPDIWVWNPQGDNATRIYGFDSPEAFASPRHNQGIVVTPERFLVALGADGDPRNIRWADQESLEIWRPTPENQAGDFVLPGSGIIMCGSRARQETLIWTTQDLFTMQYIGGTLVYSFAQVGTNCGIISRRGYAMVDGARALWMGTDSFFAYEGGVTPLVCEVGDDVFNDINTTQASKIFAVVFSEFSEVWWFYPSKDSDEVDKYVAYNYAEAHWSMGDLSRTAGVPRGVFPYPILMDRNGKLYDHERGGEYFDLDGETPLLPFIESGPIDIAQGDQTMWVRYIVPDENTLGDTRAYLKSRLYPTATENTFGPFSMAEPTSTRMSGRQVSLRVEQVQPGWRLGVPRLEVVPAGRR